MSEADILLQRPATPVQWSPVHDDPSFGHPSMDSALGRVEVLEGNIGYVEILAFNGSSEEIQNATERLRSLGDVDALIFDVRHCPGGEPAMVVALSSFLFGEPTHLVSSVMIREPGGERNMIERWTRPTEIDHLATVPAAVLTSRMTGSAAESFVFGLKRTGRVTLVGETTAGAGHLADYRALPGGFALQLSTGRTFDPDTGEGWEATGVKPDVEVESRLALERALKYLEGS